MGEPVPVTFDSAPQYFLHQLDAVLGQKTAIRDALFSMQHATTYNAMVRHVTSYQHHNNSQGWRTTGTFVKLMTLLPYLQRLGVNVISLLPVTQIGEVGNKGTLGSPYAVKHPLHLDENLREPNLNMDVTTQARAFIDCCHILGIKVVLEVVLRTASTDSELVPNNPEWFYWVDESRYNALEQKMPSFTADQLNEMKRMVLAKEFKNLPEPSAEYREMFMPPPFRVEFDERGWRGIGPKNQVLRIPAAFADWPADDVQPAWSDVTYLKLHDHPRYRYMAYNTVRMYERNLDVEDYRAEGLWNTIVNIIPYYTRLLDIDGAMIDMGHALPNDLRKRVIQAAKSSKPGFILFEENFSLDASSTAAGYDAVIGYLPFISKNPNELKEFVQRIANNDIPVRYFATPESHNTPRMSDADNHLLSVATWKFLQCLPKSLGFIHAGIELLETRPINTGLGFTEEDLKELSAESLPLFSDSTLPWDNAEAHTIFMEEQQQLANLSTSKILADDDLVIPVECPMGGVGFIRFNANKGRGLLCLLNTTPTTQEVILTVPDKFNHLVPSVDARLGVVGETIVATVAAHSCLVLAVWGSTKPTTSA